jgi:hypothetical protein
LTIEIRELRGKTRAYRVVNVDPPRRLTPHVQHPDAPTESVFRESQARLHQEARLRDRDLRREGRRLAREEGP